MYDFVKKEKQQCIGVSFSLRQIYTEETAFMYKFSQECKLDKIKKTKIINGDEIDDEKENTYTSSIQ